jgi:ATP-dependent helicase/nuclease subunit A
LAPEKVEAQLAEMVQREILSTQQAESIRVNEIVRFLQSPLGERMLQSKELQRELSFTMSLPTRELYGEAGGIAGETIILQGTIDCLFEEDGAFVLLDYKTDAVKAGEEEILKERYKIQLDLYARAVETIFGRPVKEKLIYSFALQQALVLE